MNIIPIYFLQIFPSIYFNHLSFLLYKSLILCLRFSLTFSKMQWRKYANGVDITKPLLIFLRVLSTQLKWEYFIQTISFSFSFYRFYSFNCNQQPMVEYCFQDIKSTSVDAKLHISLMSPVMKLVLKGSDYQPRLKI